ncbi:MAG TPA: tetratricopeptide repeat protein [Magnetococcales bacterium]|nr:tetratricopeptide repeat protein [Magnetococcales bacterium]
MSSRNKNKPKKRNQPPGPSHQPIKQGAREKAFALYAAGNIPAALEIANKILRTAKNDFLLLNLAAICHQLSGNPQQAISCWQEAVRIRPDYADAHYNFGNLMYEMKHFAEAEAAYRLALRFKPEFAQAHNNLGIVLHAMQRYNEAAAAYRQALHHKCDFASACNNLGITLNQMQQRQQAEAAFRQAIHFKPDYTEACNNLGIILNELQRFDEAEAACRQALHFKPDDVNAYNNLGIILHNQKRFAEAEEAYLQALRLHPNHAEVFNNYGNLLKGQKQFAKAMVAFREALSLNPNFAGAYNNLGNLLLELKHAEEAEAAYRQALCLQPDYPEAYNNLGNLFKELKQVPQSEAAYRQALHLRPDYHEAKYNLSFLLLGQARFQEGWLAHEARHNVNRHQRILPSDAGPIPMWNGEDLREKSLLILPEQGFGDQIQFCRYARVLKTMGVKHLTLACEAALKELFQSLPEKDAVMEKQTHPYPRHDFWTFYLSIPHHLGTTLSSIPAPIPYLAPPPGHAFDGIQHLPQQRFRVGLVWKGDPTHKNDANRSLPGLHVLAPLWTVPGVAFVSLQKGCGEDAAKNPPPEQPLLHLGASLRSFADTAALLARLDLVITIDSAVAHLAGAMGKPCWVLLPSWGTDWRWLQDRSDSPWYPKVMRLFRQTKPDDWSEVVQHMTEALAQSSMECKSAAPKPP